MKAEALKEEIAIELENIEASGFVQTLLQAIG